ncbi:hypothetical protein BBF96_12100 [Anoxybacter fermentans]|uniref:Uncharacterized protein n=1 Tax=Anoxybacter fermentans TaxID=1323375 RepID=A0A3S9T0E5_9FIRM|nr:hypothetical protein [Anoxybacter fermentans]AZR74073.1 hypothetical protein BBF96_12100 [Anoxybacter fermentans]
MCKDCEETFSKVERAFALNIFYPYQNDTLGNQDFQYGEWLYPFIVSVNWRILYLDLAEFRKSQSLNETSLKILSDAEESMRNFLLGNIQNVLPIENHLFLFPEISIASPEIAKQNPNVFFRTSAYGYILINTGFNSFYVYSNLAGILLVTIIKKAQGEVWNNTIVDPSGGIIKIPRNVRSPLINDVLEYCKEQKNWPQISDQQKQKIIDKIKENINKFENSRFYKFFMADENLKKSSR